MTKGIPRRDGSGRGIGANWGRGGCATPRGRGRRNPPRNFRRSWW